MAQYGFGVGVLSITDMTATNPTPVVCGVLQDVSVEINQTTKELRGAFQFPVDVTRASGTIQGKAKFAQIGYGTIAAITNGTVTTGMKIASINEAATPIAGTFTVTPSHASDFYENISVVNASTGVLMNRVAAASEAAGVSYSLNAATGVYTFADASPVLLTYTYDSAAGVGHTVTYTNQLMGAVTTFKLDLHNSFKSKHYGFRLPAVIIPKLGFAPKQDDYTSMDVDFLGMQDSAGTVFEFFSTE